MHRYAVSDAVKERLLRCQGKLVRRDRYGAHRAGGGRHANHFVAEGFPAEVPLSCQFPPSMASPGRYEPSARGPDQRHARSLAEPAGEEDHSAFIAGPSDIDAQLNSRGIDSVLIAGTATNGCAANPPRGAMMLDYRVVMLSDANATWTEEHAATLNNSMLFFGDVTTAAIGRLVPAKSRKSA